MPRDAEMIAVVARLAAGDDEFAALCRRRAMNGEDGQAGAFATAYAVSRFNTMLGELASMDLAEQDEHEKEGAAHAERMAELAVQSLGVTREELMLVKAGKAKLRVEPEPRVEDFHNPDFRADLASFEEQSRLEVAMSADLARAEETDAAETPDEAPGYGDEAPPDKGERRQAASERARRNGA